jgi:isoprenylcysteine carboxyl methyltransferase (ICMT) family protein YpbQ
VLTNSHGQNILYLGMGSLGVVNFLFYSPVILYFVYALVEFYNMKVMSVGSSERVRGFVK